MWKSLILHNFLNVGKQRIGIKKFWYWNKEMWIFLCEKVLNIVVLVFLALSVNWWSVNAKFMIIGLNWL